MAYISVMAGTSNTYWKTEDGELCPSKSLEIQNEEECQVAAKHLGQRYDSSGNWPGDFPACMHTNDYRNAVCQEDICQYAFVTPGLFQCQHQPQQNSHQAQLRCCV